MGLDDAGKTSIILVLKRELSKIAYLRPTRGIERRIFSFFGEKIIEHDLGGQTSFRITYLNNPDKFLDNTAICIYTIDIQNEERIPESLAYFKEILLKYTALNLHPIIYIFFHKYDPQLKEIHEKEFEKRCNYIKSKIIEETRYDKIHYYKTSIYDFEHLIRVMSEIFLELHPKSGLINEQIEKLSIAMNAQGAILLDDNSLIVAEFHVSEEIKNILYKSMAYLLFLNDSFVSSEEKFSEPAKDMIIEYNGRFFIFKQLHFDGLDMIYYLILLKNDNEQINDSYIEEFKVQLKKIIER